MKPVGSEWEVDHDTCEFSCNMNRKKSETKKKSGGRKVEAAIEYK